MKIFLSYTRRKDEFGEVSKFQRHLENELSLLAPGSTIFLDVDGIGAGDQVAEELALNLARADVLLVLLSPAWLASDWCRREYELFLDKEGDWSRRVLPVLWVPTEELHYASDDEVAKDLSGIMYDDWTDLRHENWGNPSIRKRVAKLAEFAWGVGKRDPKTGGEANHKPPTTDGDKSLQACGGPLVILGSLVGAFGMINVLDSLAVVYGGQSWRIVPLIVEPVFGLFRIATRSLFELIPLVFHFAVPPVVQDYLAMGIIVAGMRLRSTMVIRRGIVTGRLTKYSEDVFGWSVDVNGHSTLSRWLIFFFVRLCFAFLFWPIKLFGAAVRYTTGQLRNRGQGLEWRQVQSQQYLVFFQTVAWALIILVLFLIAGASGL